MLLIIIETFYAITAALVIFTGLELLWPRIIYAYFNLDWLLILWFINVIVLMFINKPAENNKNKNV